MLDMDQLLISLPDFFSVSGFEKSGIESFCGIAAPYFDKISISKSDSIICVKYAGDGDSAAHPTLLIDTHFDEIGMMTARIEKDGFVRIEALGGLDLRVLCGAEVVIHGREDIFGVILPSKASPPKDGSLPEIDSLVVYTGMDREALESRVSVGDPIAFLSPALPLLDERIAGKAFDNRASIAAAIGAVSLLDGETHGWNIALLLSSGEETNMRGAVTGTFDLKPDASIVIDVGFARVPQTNEKDTLAFGCGPSVSMSAVTDRKLTKALIAAAEKHGAMHQIIVEAMGTGTNANVIPLQNGGIPCAVVSIPLGNMHTPNEIIKKSDIEYTAQFIASFIKEGGTLWRK